MNIQEKEIKEFDDCLVYCYVVNGKKIGIFRKDTPKRIMKIAKEMFDGVEYE